MVWGFIGGLCFVVILEVAGKLSYDRALSSLQDGVEAHKRGDPFTVDEALSRVKRPPRNLGVEGSGQEIYEWRWPSLFKTYRLKIVASAKDHVVTDLKAGDQASSE